MVLSISLSQTPIKTHKWLKGYKMSAQDKEMWEGSDDSTVLETGKQIDGWCLSFVWLMKPLQQTGWLNTTYTYSLTVSKVRNPKRFHQSTLRCGSDLLPWEALGQNLSPSSFPESSAAFFAFLGSCPGRSQSSKLTAKCLQISVSLINYLLPLLWSNLSQPPYLQHLWLYLGTTCRIQDSPPISRYST